MPPESMRRGRGEALTGASSTPSFLPGPQELLTDKTEPPR